jgi:uncharacterized Rossmann fold enzyme
MNQIKIKLHNFDMQHNNKNKLAWPTNLTRIQYKIKKKKLKLKCLTHLIKWIEFKLSYII